MRKPLASLAGFLVLAACLVPCRGDSPDARLLVGKERIQHQLDTLTIPAFVLKNTTLPEALALLTRATQHADPEHIGITFVIGPVPSSVPRINLDWSKASPRDILRAIMAITGLGYSLDDTKVTVVYVMEKGLTCRSIPVRDGVFAPSIYGPADSSYDALPRLQSMGVKVPPGVSVRYRTSTHSLLVIGGGDSDDLTPVVEQIEAALPRTDYSYRGSAFNERP